MKKAASPMPSPVRLHAPAAASGAEPAAPAREAQPPHRHGTVGHGKGGREGEPPAGAVDHDEGAAALDLDLAALAKAATGEWQALRLYSAPRNERLKRKHAGEWQAASAVDAMAEDPYIAVELSKSRGAKKAYAAVDAKCVRRSMPTGGGGAAGTTLVAWVGWRLGRRCSHNV
ncbi:hypothetical protein ACP70R_005888 [Stipagrostis hirtigluma subsp. patula]